MQIEAYKQAAKLPEKYLPSLVDAQIECWGSKPFDEYMICENPKCRALYSIEDVHGSIEEYRTKINKIVNFKCRECNFSTKQFYEKEEFIEEIREYVKREASIILLLEDEKVEGFSLMSKTILGELINYEFATRDGSYNKNLLLKEISTKIFGIDDAKDKELIHWNQIYIAQKFRNKNIAFKLAKLIFFLNQIYKDLPLIIETRFDSNFYPVGRDIGFEDILKDNHGYIVQFLQKFDLMLSYISQNKSFKGKRKYYK